MSSVRSVGNPNTGVGLLQHGTPFTLAHARVE